MEVHFHIRLHAKPTPDRPSREAVYRKR
jgi:hypothetical protein